MKVIVSKDPPLSSRVRKEPNQSAAIVGLIGPGERLTITDGPGCADGYVWWKVESARGVAGWTIEGDASSQWLVTPLPPTATPTRRPSGTPVPTINATGTRQRINQLSTATVQARQAQATRAAQNAQATRVQSAASQTALAATAKAKATQAIQNRRATLAALSVAQTATVRAAPTATAIAKVTATAARANFLQSLTAMARAKNVRATQAVVNVTNTAQAALRAQATATAQAVAALAAEYRSVFYSDLNLGLAEGEKVRFRAYVKSFSPQEVVVYTGAPDRLIVLHLRAGASTDGLKISSTVAFTFYGVTDGRTQACDSNGCVEAPLISEAFWIK
jgi:hypothetical protein